MKLVINIPCLNEEQTLPLVLKEIPKSIKGVDKIIVQVVDDGSTDHTRKVAEKFGCRVISHKTNYGLGIAFKSGMEAALEDGADIMVNTDADNQYPSRYIPDLIQPIIEKNADVVIGDRQTWKVKHFSVIKRFLQWFGSATVRMLTQTDVRDTVSGFRAYSRESLLRLNVTTRFSYVLDTIMQCAKKNLKIESVKITTNEPTRDSRLFKNMFQHIRKSGLNLLKVYVLYHPLPTFLFLSILFFLPSFILIIRYLYYFFTSGGGGHIQSLIAATILFITAVLMFMMGILSDLVRTNRELIEEQLYLQKKQRYRK
jgi:glycosyltransferase involved in cell wall biosynthesis